MNEPNDAIRRLTDAVGQMQGQGIAYNYILFEILLEMASAQSKPEKFLAAMFDRVIARCETGLTATQEAHRVSGETKRTIEEFFSDARTRIS